WLPVMFSDLNIETFWIRRPKPLFIVDYFYYYFGKDAVVMVVCVVLIGLVLKYTFSMAKPERHERAIFVILFIWLVFSYLIPYLKSIAGTPILYVRYTI